MGAVPRDVNFPALPVSLAPSMFLWSKKALGYREAGMGNRKLPVCTGMLSAKGLSGANSIYFRDIADYTDTTEASS